MRTHEVSSSSSICPFLLINELFVFFCKWIEPLVYRFCWPSLCLSLILRFWIRIEIKFASPPLWCHLGVSLTAVSNRWTPGGCPLFFFKYWFELLHYIMYTFLDGKCLLLWPMLVVTEMCFLVSFCMIPSGILHFVFL